MIHYIQLTDFYTCIQCGCFLLCYRLKGLLPQTEVSSTVSSDPRQGPKRVISRKCSDKKTAADNTGSDEGWSTGDESIDEFTNTEERSSMEEKPAFSLTCRHETHLSLPSLISAEDANTSPPPSSDSVTLGSLKQSPIDLSLSPSIEASSQTVVTENNPSLSSTSDSNTDQGVAKSSEFSTVSVHQHEQCDGDTDCTPKQSATVKENYSDWCLKYECSPTESDMGRTPSSKKVRLSQESKPPLRRLFETESQADPEGKKEAHGSESPSYVIDLTQDEQTSLQPTDCLLIDSPPPPMIDLTREHVPSDLYCEDGGRSHKVAVTTLSTGTNTEVRDTHQKSSASRPPVTDLSDSQRSAGSSQSQRSASLDSFSGPDPFGSPNCFPPTPGRENICSILQRPEFP